MKVDYPFNSTKADGKLMLGDKFPLLILLSPQNSKKNFHLNTTDASLLFTPVNMQRADSIKGV